MNVTMTINPTRSGIAQRTVQIFPAELGPVSSLTTTPVVINFTADSGAIFSFQFECIGNAGDFCEITSGSIMGATCDFFGDPFSPFPFPEIVGAPSGQGPGCPACFVYGFDNCRAD